MAKKARKSDGKTAYRILSLDGGGAWALIQVKALMKLFGRGITGHEVLNKFDLVAANSGGSLVLGGLLEDLPLAELLDYFLDERKRKSIFSPMHLTWSNWWEMAVQKLIGFGPKYSAKAKLAAIEKIMNKNGNVPLKDIASTTGLNVRLLIIGFDYDRNRAIFFRSASAGGPGWGDGGCSGVTVAEAVHASTNAPVNYFDLPAEWQSTPRFRYWDGAIGGCNNPVLAAVMEAVVIGRDPTEIAALSLGTGSVVLSVVPKDTKPSAFELQAQDPDLIKDLKKLATSILDDPPDAASFIAHAVTGANKGLRPGQQQYADSRIIRLSPLLGRIKDTSDGDWIAPAMDSDSFKCLCSIDMDAVEQTQVKLIEEYADLWTEDKAPNQPVRIDSENLVREIGYTLFSQAAAAWNVLT